LKTPPNKKVTYAGVWRGEVVDALPVNSLSGPVRLERKRERERGKEVERGRMKEGGREGGNGVFCVTR
jgi:hypothetical protein